MNILSCCLLAALNATVGELPPCDYADTECSTNLPFAVDFREMSRFVFDLSLDASPSNAVEVAIGTDANGDGNLSVEESAYAFGYDCGTWFCRDTAKNRLDVLATLPVAALSPTNRIERSFVLNRHKVKTAWNLAKVSRRGSAPICECTSVRGRLQGLKISVR